jgi:CRISP-associated protein Cas1
MIKRIVEISTSAYVSVGNNQLTIEQDGEVKGKIPVEDLGVLILSNPAITITLQAMMACWKNNVALVACDERFMPGAVLTPLDGHSLHAKTLQQQIEATEPVKKRLWAEIVKAKIRGQVKVLKGVNRATTGISHFPAKVRSGDPENIEAQAARIYWQRLFGEGFRRDRDDPGINALLNYGYAVMRSAVARAVIGAGLMPALGIHHSNQYNAFALVDDLIEPLRPLVDTKVHEIVSFSSTQPQLDSQTKRDLISVLGWNVGLSNRSWPLLVALTHYASSVREVLAGEIRDAEIPEI